MKENITHILAVSFKYRKGTLENLDGSSRKIRMYSPFLIMNAFPENMYLSAWLVRPAVNSNIELLAKFSHK